VKNFSILLILSIYLFSTTELIQLLKIPVLISHCIEHKNNNSKLTFVQFLNDHYNIPVKDNDRDTDEKLPFVKHVNFLNITAISSTVSSEVPLMTSSIFFEKKLLFYPDQYYLNTYTCHIWQPPKIS